MRAAFKFDKTGELIYISHLDLQRGMHRAINRASLPVAYTQGFHPLPQVAFAQALGVGIETYGDCVEINFKEPVDLKAAAEALNRVLPLGIRMREYSEIDETMPSLMSLVRASLWEFRFEDAVGLDEKIEVLNRAQELILTRESKGVQKQVDIKPGILNVERQGNCLIACLSAGSVFNVRPAELLEAMGLHTYHIARKELFADDQGRLVPLMQYIKDGLF